MNAVDQRIQDALDTIKKQAKIIRWLKENRAVLEEFPTFQLWGGQLDFNSMSHANTIKLIRRLGGKWKKSQNSSNKVDYETTTAAGIKVRSWASEPPPSCRLVEVEEDVPEQIIPAHKVKRTKMVCRESAEPLISAVAFAQPANPDPLPESVPASPEPVPSVSSDVQF